MMEDHDGSLISSLTKVATESTFVMTGLPTGDPFVLQVPKVWDTVKSDSTVDIRFGKVDRHKYITRECSKVIVNEPDSVPFFCDRKFEDTDPFFVSFGYESVSICRQS